MPSHSSGRLRASAAADQCAAGWAAGAGWRRTAVWRGVAGGVSGAGGGPAPPAGQEAEQAWLAGGHLVVVASGQEDGQAASLGVWQSKGVSHRSPPAVGLVLGAPWHGSYKLRLAGRCAGGNSTAARWAVSQRRLSKRSSAIAHAPCHTLSPGHA